MVAGQDKAKYKGVGTINGGGTYGFMLTATDGSPDTFRIKIWDKDDGDAVVYHNQMGASDDEYGGTAIGGGVYAFQRRGLDVASGAATGIACSSFLTITPSRMAKRACVFVSSSTSTSSRGS